MSRIRCALVGCGHIGKRHIEVIGNHPDYELTAVVEPNGDPTEFSVPVFSALDELLVTAAKPDMVTIASPNGWHAVQAIRALEAGCHVLIEKPMAIRSADARQVIETAFRQQKAVRVVMQNRYAPEAQWLKNLVDSGRLGRLFLVQVSCLWNRDHRYYTAGSWHGDPKLDGGTLFTQFSHFVDMLYWLFGDFGNIQARIANLNHPDLHEFEDAGVAQFEFSGGGLGSFQFTTAAWDKNAESSLTIVAEYGTVRLGGQYMNSIELDHIRGLEVEDIAAELEEIRLRAYGTCPHYTVYSKFASDLREGHITSASAEDGLRVVELIEHIYGAAKRTLNA